MMLALYTYSLPVRIGFLLAAVLVLVLHCYYLQVDKLIYRVQNRRRQVLEFTVLFFILVLLLSIDGINYQLLDGMLTTNKYLEARYISCLLLLGHSLIWMQAQAGTWFLAGAAVLALPALDEFSPWGLILVLGLLFFRTMQGIPRAKADLQQSLSLNSIKEALDSLPTGVLFAEREGEIILTNVVMLHFMQRYLGGFFRDANSFWKRMQGLVSTPGLEIIPVGDKILLRVVQQQSWLAAREEIHYGRHTWVQFTVADVTEVDGKAIALREHQQKLEQDSDRLRYVLSNLEAYRRQHVLTEVKSQIHDLLGQRITILQQILNNKNFYDYVTMIPLIENVIRDMRYHVLEDPAQILKDLVATYESIGIALTVEGVLPGDRDTARTFVRIIREGATNAVRHGRANQIQILLGQLPGSWTLQITDNGIPPLEEVAWGTGLKGIRSRVEHLGGHCVIQSQPRFVVAVTVPMPSVGMHTEKGEGHD